MFRNRKTRLLHGALGQSFKAWALQSDLSLKPGSATQYGFCLCLRGKSGAAIHLDKCLNFSELQFLICQMERTPVQWGCGN